MKIRRLRKRGGGFTLVEIMVVVIVIGILAATIIPKFVGTTHDAKVATAKANIAELDSALERYNVQMDSYPSTEEGLKALVEKPANDEGKWRGPYIKMLRPDPWGQPYQYRCPGTHHTTGPDLWAKDPDNQGSRGQLMVLSYFAHGRRRSDVCGVLVSLCFPGVKFAANALPDI